MREARAEIKVLKEWTHKSFFDRNEDLLRQLNRYIDIQEQLRKCDVDFCPIFEKAPEERTEAEKYIIDNLHFGKCKEPYNRYGTPFDPNIDSTYQNYKLTQDEQWEKVLQDVEEMLQERKIFPVRRGKVFKGISVHFATADKEQIRVYLNQYQDYLDILQMDDPGGETILFTVYCRMFGMLGGIQSIWLYFGVQSPMRGQDDI